MNSETHYHKPISATDVVDIIRRRKAWLLITALLVLSGVAAYALTAKERFQARTLISIDAPLDPTRPYVDARTRMQEHLRVVNEIIFSDQVFKPVVEEFGLANPAAESPQRDLEEIRKRVRIDIDGDSAIYLGFEGSDRNSVAGVPNRLAEQLSNRTSVRREKRNESELAVIDSEVNRLRSHLATLDSRIQQYRSSAVESLPERADPTLKAIEGLQTSLRDNTAAISADEARRAGILTEMSEHEKNGPFQIETPAPKSASAEKLDAKRMELNRLQAQGLTAAHQDVKILQAEINSLQAVVAAERPVAPTRTMSPAGLRHTELKAELQTIDQRLAGLRQQQAAMRGQIATQTQRVNSTPVHEQTLNQLTREQVMARFQLEDQLAKQSAARQATQIAQIDHSVVFRVVEPAKPPLDPYSPNRLRLLLMGLGAALGLGIGMVFLVESTDTSFKDMEDLQAQTGLPVLTMVPRIKALPRKKKAKAMTDLAAQGVTAQPLDTIVPLIDPKSVPAEQYQILGTRLRRRMKPDSALVVMVTSSAGGEGKTLTSVNLATSLASSGAKVLLIDADLRRPRVHKYLGLKPNDGQGLSVLMNHPEADLADNVAKYAARIGTLSILPSQNPVPDPLNLLRSSKLPPLIERLRTQFQFIIIDSPPVLPLADGMVLGNLADRIVMVVRAHQTTEAVLRRSLDSLDTAKLAGLILNAVNMSNSKYSYVYRYYENTYLRGA
jgi:succinoglycan biosynthesis transport protein ExoP